MALFRRRTETVRERIARLEAELPDLQRLVNATADGWADEPDNEDLHTEMHNARAALQSVQDDISDLTRQLARAEAKDEADRQEAEEAADAAERAKRQKDLNRLVDQGLKQALDLSARIENMLSARARLTETLQAIEKIAGSVGFNSEHALPALIASEEKAIREADTDWENGKPHRPLVKRFEQIRNDSKDLIERKHLAALEYETNAAQSRWSGRKDLGITEHPEWDGFLAPEPMEFPLPQERNRAAYVASDFGTWPPPTPKSPVQRSTREDDRSRLSASEPTNLEDPPAITDPEAAADLSSGTRATFQEKSKDVSNVGDCPQYEDVDLGTGAGLDDPAYIAEARRMGVPADVI
jgi:hypothetical protein